MEAKIARMYIIASNELGDEVTSACVSADSCTSRVGRQNWAPPPKHIGLFGLVVFTGTLSLTTVPCLRERLGTSNWNFRVKDAEYPIRETNRYLPVANTPGQNLAQIREVLRPSITELANLFGVSRQAIYDWQAGKGISNDHAEKLEMLAKAATILAPAGIPVSQLLRRKLPGGRTLFEIVKEGDSAELAALKLLDMAKRDIQQRQRLEARLSGRKRPPIDRSDMGLPMLSEEE
jgi:transcriptional regulator with XRE-family HTH domain